MSLLSDLAAEVYAGFRGQLLAGEIWRPVGSGGEDQAGDPAAQSYQKVACEGFEESYGVFIRATAGIPDNAAKVSIFSASCPGLEPRQDDLIWLGWPDGPHWYLVRNVDSDPAHAVWTCLTFLASAP